MSVSYEVLWRHIAETMYSQVNCRQNRFDLLHLLGILLQTKMRQWKVNLYNLGIFGGPNCMPVASDPVKEDWKRWRGRRLRSK